MFKARTLAIAVAAAFASQSGIALADSKTDQQLKAQIEALQQQLDALKSSMSQVQSQQATTQAQVQTVQAQASAAPKGGSFLERKDSDDITFLTRGGEVTLYGNLDLSVESTTKGIAGFQNNDGSGGPQGRLGWQPGISSNISYIGIKGFQDVGLDKTKFVYQLETQIDVSATSGTGVSNSANSDTVKGGLTSRNSFIGLASPTWGAVKIGKTDAPYKNSTARMNPFSGMLGDYATIMGNTGGDNRVEFGTRLDHAIWYESPNMSGFTFNALVSPGQNRGTDDNNVASGESDCTGGNAPGSGGINGCTDGSFGTAYSANVAYTSGPLYATAAYELHERVNRSSDLADPTTNVYDANDVGNESASKVGVQYKFPTKTTVSAIYEYMHRNVPQYLEYQNERTRSGTWLAVSQELTPKDVLSFGWAHAGKSEGILSAHNNANLSSSLTGAGVGDNSANMYTIALVHQVDKNLSFYTNYAATINNSAAHYDLGAGGRGLTTDCHDGTSGDGTAGNDVTSYTGYGHCWAGGHLQGIVVGMRYKF
jgi:predicted porin